jgi:4-amino-4-deoxy-L-arabinose transferase-like glycosyltransferase
VVDTTVDEVSVGVVTDAVVVVGVTIVELVSVGETSVVPVAAIGAVSDVPLIVVVVSSAAGADEAAAVSPAAVSVFSAASRLHAAARRTQRKTRISLRIEQLSLPDSVRQNAGRTQRWLGAHADAVSLILILVAAIRILSTLTVFSVTSDEPLHVTAGLQLVKEGRYAWQLENPPIPRLVFGALISLGGAQFDPAREPMDMMKWLFYSSGHYKTSLFLARAGNTLFFIVAAVATWWLARRFLGRVGALIATLFFTTQPVVLGYAGIANLDNASVAGVAIALIAFHRWLERPTAIRALVAGAAFGLSIGLKFSNLLFTAAACAAIYVVYFIADRDVRRAWPRALMALPIAGLATFIALWACYGFAFGSFAKFGLQKPDANDVVARLVAPLDADTPIPMPHFFVGLSGISKLDRLGHLSYAFGKRTTEGWWWYFGAAMLFKTALATLILAIAGFFVARSRLFVGSMAAVLGILITAMPAKLDLGIRYVLPLYVPLTIAAAAAALAMLQSAKPWLRIAAIVLLAWQSIASAIVHPDYFPYFNELAGRQPGRYFIDSNLDWGQDLLRLRAVLRREKIDKIGIYAAGLHDYDRLGFAGWYQLEPWLPQQGWVAVSEHMYRMLQPDGGFWWLRGRKYRRIGTSIRLYYVP